MYLIIGRGIEVCGAREREREREQISISFFFSQVLFLLLCTQLPVLYGKLLNKLHTTYVPSSNECGIPLPYWSIAIAT